MQHNNGQWLLLYEHGYLLYLSIYLVVDIVPTGVQLSEEKQNSRRSQLFIGGANYSRYLTTDDTQLFLFLSLRDSETVEKKEKKLNGLPVNYESTVSIVDWD
eukprot:scaffold2477_cov285-Chaetoceros_neogracile.AAC.2